MRLKISTGKEIESELYAACNDFVSFKITDMDQEKIRGMFGDPGLTQTMTLGEDEYRGFTYLYDIIYHSDACEVICYRPECVPELRQKILDNAVTVAKIQAQTFSDMQALMVRNLYKNWEEDPIGHPYSMSNPNDYRRNYNGGLWNLNKEHKKQADWYPGADPTLWTEIVEGHAGTVDDPIPVPDSVTTSGFDYVYGKYYSEGGAVYLCQRQGIQNPESMYGQTEKLYFAPSALVGQYFVQII